MMTDDNEEAEIIYSQSSVIYPFTSLILAAVIISSSFFFFLHLNELLFSVYGLSNSLILKEIIRKEVCQKIIEYS